MLVTTKRGLSFGSRLGWPSDFRLIKDATLVLPGLLRLCSGTLHRRVRSLHFSWTGGERHAWPARPNDPTPHWRPGSRHIPHEAGGLETPEPPAPQNPHPSARGRALRERGIQTPKASGANADRTAGAGNITRAQHGGNQILFRLVVEGEKADHRQITVAIVVAIEKGELLLAVPWGRRSVQDRW